MTKGRLEAFSDGVFAVVITIMVLELKAPHGETLEALEHLAPQFLAYVLSFIYIGIYWSNHHHLLHTVKHVNGGMMWANLHLLFWLSLFPFLTAWVGEHPSANWPSATYGVVLLITALAWLVLQRTIKKSGSETLEKALGTDLKGKLSPLIYIAGIALSFYATWLAYIAYAIVALMWVIPDRRIEREVRSGEDRV
jgi:uncharacterized membrane protein